MTTPLDRRTFLRAAAIGVGSGSLLRPSQIEAAPAARAANEICVFTKPLQSLSFDDLAGKIAELGFDGLEAPIRVEIGRASCRERV